MKMKPMFIEGHVYEMHNVCDDHLWVFSFDVHRGEETKSVCFSTLEPDREAGLKELLEKAAEYLNAFAKETE